MSKKVTFFFHSTLLHFTQLITGLEILNQKKEINLKYQIENKNFPVDVCRVNYEGKMLIFDMADSSIIREDVYEECDFYIKRMLQRRDFEGRKKLIPYGLNYMVFYENQYIRNLIFKRKFSKYAIRYNPTLSKVLNLKNSINTAHLKKFETQPKNDCRVLFRTRLWDPANNPTDWKKKEREKMNQERIQINRIMKEKLGESFDGGIEEDDFSKKQCPDLLLTKEQYHKKNYFQLLKKSTIGIVNPGLEDSIGWKFGEYVAYGLAIVTTPVDHYMFCGEFKEGENYLCFSGVSELVEKIEVLKSNPGYRKEIQNSNLEYYRNWLEPSAKLRSILRQIETS